MVKKRTVHNSRLLELKNWHPGAVHVKDEGVTREHVRKVVCAYTITGKVALLSCDSQCNLMSGSLGGICLSFELVQ